MYATKCLEGNLGSISCLSQFHDFYGFRSKWRQWESSNIRKLWRKECNRSL